MTPIWLEGASWLEGWLLHAQRDWLDAAGRPLGEVGSPLYPADTRERACPYAGSRLGRPMNVDALRQVRAHWSTTLATLGTWVGEAPTVEGVLDALTAAVTLPHAHCAAHPDAPIPEEVAALYKTAVGFHQTVLSVLLDNEGLAAEPALSLGDGERMLSALEQGGWLVGQEQACAGPPGDIEALFDVLIGRRRPGDGEALDRPAVAERASEVLGLAVALVLSTRRLVGRGVTDELAGLGTYEPPMESWPLGARMWKHSPSPWVLGATVRAEREPQQARRLYTNPPGGWSTFVQAAEAAASHAELEYVFHHAVHAACS